MKKELIVGNERLKGVLIHDKRENPNKILNVLKSELLYVLKNYMDVGNEDLNLNIIVNKSGKYEICFNVEVARIKVANYLL